FRSVRPGYRRRGRFALWAADRRLLVPVRIFPLVPAAADGVQNRRALVGPERLAAVLDVAAGRLRRAAGPAEARAAGQHPGAGPGHHACQRGVFRRRDRVRGPPLRDAGLRTAGRTGPEPAAAELLDDLAPGHAVSGLRGLFRALCRRVRLAYRAPERPRLDSPDPPLDHDGVAGLEPGHGAGFPLGLRGAGLGRLLGVG